MVTAAAVADAVAVAVADAVVSVVVVAVPIMGSLDFFPLAYTFSIHIPNEAKAMAENEIKAICHVIRLQSDEK